MAAGEEVIAARIIIEERGVPAGGDGGGDGGGESTKSILADIRRMTHKSSTFGLGGLGGVAGTGAAAGWVAAVLGVLGLTAAQFHAGLQDGGLQNPSSDPMNSNYQPSTGELSNNQNAINSFDNMLNGLDWGGNGSSKELKDLAEKFQDIMKDGIESQDELNSLLEIRNKVEENRRDIVVDISDKMAEGKDVTQQEMDLRSGILDLLLQMNDAVLKYNEGMKEQNQHIRTNLVLLTDELNLQKQIAKAKEKGKSDKIKGKKDGKEYEGRIITDKSFNGGNPTFIGVRPVG